MTQTTISCKVAHTRRRGSGAKRPARTANESIQTLAESHSEFLDNTTFVKHVSHTLALTLASMAAHAAIQIYHSLVVAIVAAGLGAFIIQNTDSTPVTWLIFTSSAPLWVVVVLAAVAGAVLSELGGYLIRRRRQRVN